MVQWFPESLLRQAVPATRPRVYLIDLEYAHEFAEDIPEAERVLTGLPFVGYLPKVAPEVSSGEPYNPFKADVWQLANGFSNFEVSYQ